ncbi:hypothetical protein [Bradyrhizobium sp. AUGA SZCCT0283]|uniref:hypothetical protein n=1 Tax=Bradyrhizobium sp. AUGA SZCCT0283 TaxID=2807671 RepID=UPI001BA971BB|nr:hypothetical protein [Bradyrhizobium sp. AUGA SZCCT0283]MBR1277471.1 hypothetical protein [Bradyrhizobium sp. AUGA SZCCT0283]
MKKIDGAPEEIRTPDPQIRSLKWRVDSPQHFCKPGPKPYTAHQRVAPAVANQKHAPDKPEMRRAASAKGSPNRIEEHHTSDNNDLLLYQQADRLAKLHALSYAVAVTVAQLAFGVVR